MSTSSSASTHKPAHHSLINPYGTTAAPPPTPSTQPNNHQHTSTSDAATVDALTRLLQRLPPNLSLPSRLSPRTATIVAAAPPTISLSQPKPELLSAILSASTQLGFFQLTHHPITHQLAELSESDAIALFNLPSEHKRRLFPKKNWPLGYESSEEGEEDEGDGCTPKESFCLDSRCSTDRHHQSESSTESETSSSLREFTRGLERLGLDVVELLSCATGLKGVDRNMLSSLMWVSEGSAEDDYNTHDSGRMYPYIVGLQYQTRCQKYSLMTDTGSVVVEPEVDSVLVTLGDIAQVWSNGKTKKVRGRAVPIMKGNKNSSSSSSSTRCISMSLLVTLPLIESVVVPLLPPKADSDGEEGTLGSGESELKVEEEDGGKLIEDGGSSKRRVFNSFSFEEYARRIYHERRLLLFKDPLDMYRIY